MSRAMVKKKATKKVERAAKKKRKNKSARPAQKAGRTAGVGAANQRSGTSNGRASSDRSTATVDNSNALPNSGVRTRDINLLRALVDRMGLWLGEGEHSEVSRAVPVPPAPQDSDAMGRLLATTSEIREQNARIEASFIELRQRVSVLEEHQRSPPAHTLSREAAARTAGMRWMIANQCRAADLLRPTPAIIGRVMHDEQAYAPESAKSPQVLFLAIYSTVTRVCGLPSLAAHDEPTSNRDHLHLTVEMVDVIEGRSSRPQSKHSTYYDKKLKPRLTLLVNSGLVNAPVNLRGRRVNYFRYLTSNGRDVFDDWPAWTDVTGGISAADEPDSPPEAPTTTEPDASATAS